MVTKTEKLILARLDKLEKENKKLQSDNKKLRQQLIQRERVIQRQEVAIVQQRKKKYKPTTQIQVLEKDKSGFGTKIIRHKKYLIIRGYNGKIIEKERYSKKTYDKNFRTYNSNGSFDENTKRKRLETHPDISEVRVKGTPKKIKPKKGEAYRYVYTLKKKRTGKIIAVTSGKSANSLNKNINDKYSRKKHLGTHTRISDKHAQQSAEYSLYTFIAKLEEGDSNGDEGEKYFKGTKDRKAKYNEDEYELTRETVWYE
jgi:hypothetical protein